MSGYSPCCASRVGGGGQDAEGRGGAPCPGSQSARQAKRQRAQLAAISRAHSPRRTRRPGKGRSPRGPLLRITRLRIICHGGGGPCLLRTACQWAEHADAQPGFAGGRQGIAAAGGGIWRRERLQLRVPGLRAGFCDPGSVTFHSICRCRSAELFSLSFSAVLQGRKFTEMDMAMMVRHPTTWTILQHDGPNHLRFWCNAAP